MRRCVCRIAILPDRQLPDKAVSVLDTACARLALGQNSIPPAIEDATRTLEDLAVQDARSRARSRPSASITRSGWRDREEQTRDRSAARGIEGAVGEGEGPGQRRFANLRRKLEARQSRRSATAATAEPPHSRRSTRRLRARAERLNAELDALQGETPLMRVCVDAQIVGEVVSGWTGIPVGKMLQGRNRARC